jgi:hypothetical protein
MKTYSIIYLILFTVLFTSGAQQSIKPTQQERIFLHTDRNIYTAGEHLFYSVYLFGNQEPLSRYAYLVLSDRKNSVVRHLRLEMNNNKSFGSFLLPDTLSSGFYQVTSYTNLMRNNEETIFRKEILISNRFDEEFNFLNETNTGKVTAASVPGEVANSVKAENIIIHSDKQVYNSREKISFQIKADRLPENSLSRLSISVSEVIPGIPGGQSIIDYFNRNTESEKPLNPDPAQFSYIPELYGTVLQGKIIFGNQQGKTADNFSNNGIGAVNEFTVLLSAIDSIANMQYTSSDSTGFFSFPLNPYYEGKELIIRLKNKTVATIVIDSKISIPHSLQTHEIFTLPGLKEILKRNNRIAQIQRFYNKKVVLDTQRIFLAANTIPRVYNKDYEAILPSDYIELPDFIEISREILPSFKVRKMKDGYVSDFSNLQYQSESDEEPLIFLDGVPIDDVNQIINLGTPDIKRIVPLPAVRFYGPLSFNGILDVSSRKTEINNVRLKTPVIRFTAPFSQPYTKPVPFNPGNIAPHHPDLRQLLLWEPDFILNSNEKKTVECYASDLPGKYLISIQGFTKEGHPVSGSAVITILSR